MFGARLFAGSCQTVARRLASRVVNCSKMRIFSTPLTIAVIIALAAPVWAQSTAGKSRFSADSVRTTPNGARADGNVIIRQPEFDFDADALAYDGAKLQEFTEIRARGNVKLRLAPRPKNPGDLPFQIQSKSDEATLTRTNRTLVLKGHLSGFYRVGDGPQTLLSGDEAIFNFVPQGLNAVIKGAAGQQVELLLPAETNKPDALGPITVRSDSLRVDEANNAAYFSGNARALSDSGPNKLDVAAPSFTLTRAADGTIGTLVTNGKTVTKINVAPDPNATATSNTLSYVEVTADKATVNRASSTGVFEGNVVGFYRLQNSPTPFNFKGERVTINYDAKGGNSGNGLSVNVTGTPVDIEVPEFSLGF